MRRVFAAANMDSASVVVDDLVANPKSETSARCALGRKERLKNRALRYRTHAAAIVRNGDANAGSTRVRIMPHARSQPDCATLTGRIQRIANQVREDLPHISGETQQRIGRSITRVYLRAQRNGTAMEERKHAFKNL